jgi:outer membrane protein TolC
VTAVENAFYELIYARENLQVQQQALALAQTQLNDDKKRVEVGTIAQSGGTIEQDESEVAQNRANLIAAQFTLASDENTLKNLITDNYPQWHDVSLQPTETLTAVRQLFDVQDSWSKGLGQRPDLLQAKLSVEQQGIQLKYDRNQLYPQLDLKGSYGYNGSGRGFDGTFDQYGAADRPYYSYGAALSLPLSNARARNSLKADKATEQQLLLKLKQLEQNVMVQIDDAVKNAQSAWESVDATQKARIYAEAALKAEQGKYAVGKSTTFTVLQLQNSLTSARSQEIRMVANYNEALASLAQQEGSTLERHQLDLHVK